MEKLIAKYINKLCDRRLARKDKISFIGLDDVLFLNKTSKNEILELSKIFQIMNINSILFAEPAEPYRSIISELTKNNYPAQAHSTKHKQHIKTQACESEDNYRLTKKITPIDCETRTFLHDIPVVNNFSAELLAEALSERKSAIIKDLGIISYGTVTPEQAYISYSSACFAAYVKYFADTINYFENCFFRKTAPQTKYLKAFNKIADYVKRHTFDDSLLEAPFINYLPCPIQSQRKKCSFNRIITKKPKNENEVIRILSETGKIIVKLHLVDSYFGNISYVFGNNIFISQTGASMDELELCIDKVPLDGSSSVGITSSSELPTHMKIYYQTGHSAILHAHPRFSVIMSLYCSSKDCPHFTNRLICHTGCTERRYISQIPVVPGEIGTGQTGLVNSVPAAIGETGGVIVYGHGVFTSGKEDFNQALSLLVNIERTCYTSYFNKVNEYINHPRY